MTAKQKANQARFKKVVKEAGRIRKKNLHISQGEAVKQAWAILYSKKRKIGVAAEAYKGSPSPTKKQATPAPASQVRYTTRNKGGQVGKVNRIPGKHTDTRSHNVNIKVVSGIADLNRKAVMNLDFFVKELDNSRKQYNYLKDLKKKQSLSAEQRQLFNKYPFVIRYQQRQIAEAKKQIK